jgi:integrase
VFTTTTGASVNPAYVTRRFSRIVAMAGLPQIRLHDLRHASASLGLASGESLLEVSRRLGHSSLAITADIYSNIAPPTARASTQRLQDYITSSVFGSSCSH